MAIEKDKDTQHAGQHTAAIGSSGPAIPPMGDRPLMSLLSGGGSIVNRNPSSEVLTAAYDAFKKVLEKTPIGNDAGVALVKIDNSQYTDLQLSAILVAVYPSDKSQKLVSYHTLLLEASGNPIDPIVVNIAGQNFTEDRYTEVVYDQVYATQVDRAMAAAFPGFQCINASAEVVPRDFNFEDERKVRDLIVNAVLAAGCDLDLVRRTATEIDLTQVARDCNLQVQIGYNQSETQNVAGLPVRSDLSISLSAQAIERGNTATVNNARKSTTLGIARGFIDLVWNPQQPQNQMNWAVPQNQASSRVFQPRLVLTALETVFRYPTIGAQLLSVLSVLPFAENGGWFPYFRPRHMGMKSGEIDIRNVGVINIEGNMLKETDKGGYGSPVDTKTSTFDDMQLGQLLSTLVDPRLVISLDVGRCQGDTWYNEVFAAAALGDPNAQNVILNAANVTTGGNFGQFFQGNQAVVEFEEVILNGYYTGSDGLRHDIRDIDYVAVMNMVGVNDPKAGAAWSDTFLRIEQPLAKRLDARKRMLRELLRGDVTFTGTSRRVTFTAAFLDAYAKGVARCNFGMRVVNPGANGEFQSQRGVAGFAQAAALPLQASGLFNQGYGQGAPGQPAQYFTGRTWR